MKVSLIVAMGSNRVIGKDNDIPWRIPKDWEYVKEVTSGSTIVMGRKNLESIGRALPGRRNIVLTRDKDYTFTGCEVMHSVEEVFAKVSDDGEVFIFGGEEIYRLFMPYVTKMYITVINQEFEGDTYFPKVVEEEWELKSWVQGVRDSKNQYDYEFHVLERKNSGAALQ